MKTIDTKSNNMKMSFSDGRLLRYCSVRSLTNADYN